MKGWKLKVESILSFSFLALSAIAGAQPGYTNHAGNVVAGWPVKLTQKQVSLAEGVVTNGCQLSTNDCRLTTSDNNFSTFQPFNFSTTNTYPLSIFPESERRRIAACRACRLPCGGRLQARRRRWRVRASARRRGFARRRRATPSMRSPPPRSKAIWTSRSSRASSPPPSARGELQVK